MPVLERPRRPELYNPWRKPARDTRADRLALRGAAGLWGFLGAPGQVRDSIGRADGSLPSGVSWTTKASRTGANPVLSFDGSAHITLNDVQTLKPTKAISFGCWAYLNTGGSGGGRLIGCGVQFGGGWELDFDNYTLGATAQVGGAVEASHGYGNFTANVWTHLACTWDGATILFYQDGVPLSAGTAQTSPITYSNPVTIGGRSGYEFTGYIDAPFVISVGLTKDEINRVMREPWAPYKTAQQRTWFWLSGPSATNATVSPSAATATGAALAPAVSASSTVAAPLATATATALAPAVSASVIVSPPVATATASAPSPTLTTGATLAPPVATATAGAPTPTLSAGSLLAPPVASATASAPTPAVSASSTVVAPVATATAQAPVPTVSGTGAGTVAAPTMTASGAAIAPTLSASATLAPPLATATALAPTPAVSIGVQIQVPLPTVAALMLAPALSWGGLIQAPVATAQATLLAPSFGIPPLSHPTGRVTTQARAFRVVTKPRTTRVQVHAR